MPSIHLSVSVDSPETLDRRSKVASALDKSRDVYTRTVGVTPLFNQSSLLAIILSRLVSSRCSVVLKLFQNIISQQLFIFEAVVMDRSGPIP